MEPKIKTYYYKESEFSKRIPNSRFLQYKILENFALSIVNPLLKVYIICPGFIYGCGEDFFYDYFRICLEGGIEYLPIIGDGDNHIPTIHVLDLVNVIKRIVESQPDINYIYACDRTKNPTLKNIMRSISKGVGGINVKNLKDFNIDGIDLPHFTELNIDVRFKSSTVFNDEKRLQGEDIEDYNDRIFKWHCEFGIPENINIIRDEFNLYRDLKPIKIFITGPPCGGKTTITKAISEKYKLPHLTIDSICEWAKNQNTPFGELIRSKWEEIEENVIKAAEEYEHRKNKKKTDPPFDPSSVRKFPPELLNQIIKQKINNGECVTIGFILENYPKTYEDCINLFNDNSEKEEEHETKKITINKKLLPDSVIIINNYTEESLKDKLNLLLNLLSISICFSS